MPKLLDKVKDFFKPNVKTIETDVKQIFYVENDQLQANWNEIEKILLADEVKNTLLKLIVISGLEGTGKSTLCNLLLYLSGMTNEIDKTENAAFDAYLYHEEREKKIVTIKALFKTNLSAKLTTSGIWMTNKPLKQKINGKNISLFLVDCQGVCGGGESEARKIIGRLTMVMGTIMASDFVYNIDRKIQYTDEMCLVDFIDDTKKISQDSKVEPIILVRNWRYIKDHKSGFASVDDYYEAINGEKPKDFQHIFNDVKCFLMPPPVETINDIETEEGCFQNLNCKDEFYKMVNILYSKLIDKDNTRIRYLDKCPANGEMMYNFMKNVWESIQKGDLNSISCSLFDVKNEIINWHESERLFEIYKENIKNECENFIQKLSLQRFSDDLDKIKRKHDLFREQSISEFKKRSRNNGRGMNDKDYGTILAENINNYFKDFEKITKKYKDCWENYLNGMNEFFQNNLHETFTDDSYRTKIQLVHERLIHHNLNKVGGKVFDVDIKQQLETKTQALHSYLIQNVKNVREKLEEYKKKMNEDFDKRNLFCIQSNFWISLDNFNWNPYEVIPSHDVIDGELEIDFRELVYRATEDYFEKQYSFSKKTEDVLSGAGILGGTVAASTGGILLYTSASILFPLIPFIVFSAGAISFLGSGTFLAYRHQHREERNKKKGNKKTQ